MAYRFAWYSFGATVFKSIILNESLHLLIHPTHMTIYCKCDSLLLYVTLFLCRLAAALFLVGLTSTCEQTEMKALS